MADVNEYAQWFRASSPYIRAHRGKTFVVVLGADTQAAATFPAIVHDLALLHVLGVRLVLVHEVAETNDPIDVDQHGAIARELAQQRLRLEALFSTGIPQSALRNSHISLVSGNLLTARPKGIIDGLDYGLAGTTRRIHTNVVRDLLGSEQVVLASPIGYSPSGISYCLDALDLAVELTTALSAEKLIVYHDQGRVFEQGDLTTTELATRLDDLSPSPTARRLIALRAACLRGTPRAHLVSFIDDGDLLTELFTAEGVGTQISDSDYRSIRAAKTADIGAIAELIRPLEENGSLVARPVSQLEREIDNFLVAELDGLLFGCCALYPHSDRTAEIACLVGGQSVGDHLLRATEEKARERGFERIIALTTRAMAWFGERGFVEGNVADLPVTKKALYNYQRNSRVLIKTLD